MTRFLPFLVCPSASKSPRKAHPRYTNTWSTAFPPSTRRASSRRPSTIASARLNASTNTCLRGMKKLNFRVKAPIPRATASVAMPLLCYFLRSIQTMPIPSWRAATCMARAVLSLVPTGRAMWMPVAFVLPSAWPGYTLTQLSFNNSARPKLSSSS